MAIDQHIFERTVIGRRDPLVGEVFDRRFRIEARIAAGGFGAIYRATHLRSGHEFALKLLHPNLTSDRRVVARFRREGAALTRLRDPHTITAYELGEADDGTLYIVMELLHGETLYERYRMRGPMPWREVLGIARAVCSSLAEAHALGIIHRDLKPTNIHLEPRDNDTDFVKVLDFGIAKILHDSEIDSTDLTNAGQMIGTLDYMSPEQMVGSMCTATSDIYTLGIVMYEMIAGRKPFDDATSAAAALASVLTTTPARLSVLAMVTPEVDRIVMQCLEHQQSDRFQSALELATTLDDLLHVDDEAETHMAPPRALVAVGVTPTSSLLRPSSAALSHHQDGGQDGVTPMLAIARPTPTTAPDLADAVPGSPAASNRLRAVPSPAHTAPSLVPITIEPTEAVPEPTPSGIHTAPVPAKHLPKIPEPVATFELDSTLLGHLPPPRVAPAPKSQIMGTPQVGMPQISAPVAPTKNLRDAYPTIHRPPPSPMRPPTPVSLDRPARPATDRDKPRARLEISVRGLMFAICIGIAIAAAIVLAGH